MAGDITKFDFSDNLRNNLGLQNVQPPINKVASFVQPVAEIIKFSNVVRTAAQAVSGTFVCYTTPTDKDFYLMSFVMSWVKDAACDNASMSLQFTQAGVLRSFFIQYVIPATAERNAIQFSFPFPIKVDKGGVLQCTGSFTAGTLSRSISIFGVEI